MEDKLFELGKNSKKIFTPVNDELCLVTKTMPVEDERLAEYIEGMKKAREAGIKIAEVVDYRLIPETTRSYGAGAVHYTNGVFLERRAKGNSNSYSSLYINTARDNDITDTVKLYLNSLLEYVRIMTERASLPQKVFNKFVNDCIKMEDYGITIDPKPSNVFIDKEDGVTIIDPIPLNDNMRVADSPHFSSYILAAFYGYGRPLLLINQVDYSVVTPEIKARLITAYAQLDSKISFALRKSGVNHDDIIKCLGDRVDKYVFRRVTKGDISEYILEGYFQEMEKEKAVSNDTEVPVLADGTIIINS